GHQIGADGHRLAALLSDDCDATAPANLVADLRRLARSLGDKVATPRPGLSEHAIAVARSWASSHGYQPPAMYDEGDPTPAVPSRQIKADLRGEKRLDMAYTVLTARRDGIALPSIAPRG